MMALKEADIINFETMKQAFLTGAAVLVESKDAATGEYRAIICAIQLDDDKMYNITPFGHMCTGNPYEQYTDPTILEKE